jgi:rare lipoprotein A (peptidoglycan hydrolase)
MKKFIYLLIPLFGFCTANAQQDTLPRLRDTLPKIIEPIKTDTLKIDSIKTDSIKIDSVLRAVVKTIDESLTGIASFYSANLDGTKTATGEIFRNSKFTAASNHFKLNTWVRVTNLKNQRSVIVRINDRMHPKMKKKGRVVDLSRIAARQLNFIKSGLTKVMVEVVPKGTLE